MKAFNLTFLAKIHMPLRKVFANPVTYLVFVLFYLIHTISRLVSILMHSYAIKYLLASYNVMRRMTFCNENWRG